jgi:hypothetical protein
MQIVDKLPKFSIYDEINRMDIGPTVYDSAKVYNENIFKKKKHKQPNTFCEMNNFALNIIRNKNWGNLNKL